MNNIGKVIDLDSKIKQAVDLHRDGYNCAQAVVVAFSNECGMGSEMAMNISAPFGGGLGRQQEVCGAVSGMSMVLGATNKFAKNKAEAYEVTRKLCGEFIACRGSMICREILGNIKKIKAEELQNNIQYYAKTNCEKCVEDATRIVANHINSIN